MAGRVIDPELAALAEGDCASLLERREIGHRNAHLRGDAVAFCPVGVQLAPVIGLHLSQLRTQHTRTHAHTHTTV